MSGLGWLVARPVAHRGLHDAAAGIIENTPDGRPVIERMASPDNLIIATLSSIGFGLSPATGHAVRDLVVDGFCGFADLSSFSLSRFNRLERVVAALSGEGTAATGGH